MKKRKVVLGIVIACAIVTKCTENKETVPTMATVKTENYVDGKPDASRGFFYGTLLKETIEDNKAQVIIEVADKQSVLVSHCVNAEALVNTCFYDSLDEIKYSAVDAQGNLLISFTVNKEQINALANDKNYKESFCKGDEPLNDLIINGR